MPSLRFVVASDTHLGYRESELGVGEDSFLAFEEVLRIAQDRGADLVILGGDVFHKNKPSRSTLDRTMQILVERAFGSVPGNAAIEMPEAHRLWRRASIPIVAIHGNHDDPCGVGYLSPLDLLHTSGLLHYFGKVTTGEDVIEIQPIRVTRPGVSVEVWIYGIGHIREHRIVRAFLDGRVRFLDPATADGGHGAASKPPAFRVLVLHQNRQSRAPGEPSLHDAMFEDFDLVVWGHEHRCIVPGHRTVARILQPGSTIVTSFAAAESAPKHAFVVDVGCGGSKAIEAVLLETPRKLYVERVMVALGDDSSSTEIAIGQLRAALEKVLEDHAMAVGGRRTVPPWVRLRAEAPADVDVRRILDAFGDATYEGRVANHDAIVQMRQSDLDDDFTIGAFALERVADADGTVDHEASLTAAILNGLAANEGLTFLDAAALSQAVHRIVRAEAPEILGQYLQHVFDRSVAAIAADPTAMQRLREPGHGIQAFEAFERAGMQGPQDGESAGRGGRLGRGGFDAGKPANPFRWPAAAPPKSLVVFVDDDDDDRPRTTKRRQLSKEQILG